MTSLIARESDGIVVNYVMGILEELAEEVKQLKDSILYERGYYILYDRGSEQRNKRLRIYVRDLQISSQKPLTSPYHYHPHLHHGHDDHHGHHSHHGHHDCIGGASANVGLRGFHRDVGCLPAAVGGHSCELSSSS